MSVVAGSQPVLALRDASGAELRLDELNPLPRREYAVAPPAWLRPRLATLLADRRDEPLLWALLNLLAVPPCCCALFALAPRSHVAGAAYLLLVYGVFAQRFFLALHYGTHRRVVRRGGGLALDALSFLLPAALAPFWGMPLGVYRLHHVAMHHGEGNGAGDFSGTGAYARDRPLHALHYVARFSLGTAFALPLYALRRGRWRAACAAAAGAGAHALLVACALRTFPVAGLYACLLPSLLSLPLLAFGNWSQHVFLKPDSEPGSAFGYAYTCVNHGDNRRTFNDGFHVEHHERPAAHWSELPAAFGAAAAAGAHGRADALAFSGAHFFDVGVAASLRGDAGLRWLAARTVDLGGPRRTRDQTVAELRRRLQPLAAAAAARPALGG